MELLNKLNKTPKVTWGQKGSQNTLPSSRTSLEHNQFSDSENWDMLKFNSRRHVNELDALTMVQVMAREAYNQQEGTKC